MWDQWVGKVGEDGLLSVCELADERVSLRLRVLREGVPADRAALRQLEMRLHEVTDGLARDASWQAYGRRKAGR